jgi:N utilization substance protein A
VKSDFMVAINQVCHERQLPVEVVLEAVEVALVSAYKRNYGANTIIAKVDQDTGAVKIFVEKEVVDEVQDEKNEIGLAEAQKIDPEATIDSVVQVESTPANFGRIAAQTTKQVILQRIREAEREALYRTYAEREGEIVNGTVQKVDPHQVILSLGKVEAVLPRSEQIPSERYAEGQRLRAFVSEVSRTPRGPQIAVSRTHRNMLKRLLELEVPEIYNGTVEIKAIAREAGYRSKVAVAALQEGVDPVGSCVGMRGVRIQSIVNELGGEKIDVAEWSPNTAAFIANALSPAKVLNVVLQDVLGDKTALVVVPDKQLSLAIGKEGQNARLAAKLTGWRIDIKSAIEAAQDALVKASGSEEIKALVSHRPEVFSLVSAILSEREEGGELSQGELNLLAEAIDLVGQAEMKIAREKQEAEKAARIKAVMEQADVDLLAEAEAILSELAPVEEPVPGEEVMAEMELAPAVEEEAETKIEAEAEIELGQVEEVAAAEEPVEEEAAEPEPTVEPEPLTLAEDEFIPSILQSVVEEPVSPKKKDKRIKPIFVDDEALEAEEDSAKRKGKTKARRLEYDENLDKVVMKRRRKKSRARNEWEDYID